MSKKNKKRKFSAVNDSQLNADDNSPKQFKKASEEQSPKNFGKKKTVESKEKALALDDVEINGRTIKIKAVAPPKQNSKFPVKRDKLSGSTFNDRHITVDSAVAAGNKEIDHYQRSIFVGNLPLNVKNETIRNTFGDCGVIEKVRVMKNRKTGIGRGYGVVYFATVESKEKALALEVVKIDGKAIKIKAAALPKQNSKFPVKRDKLSDSMPAGSKKISDDERCIFIGNLPPDVKDESIRNIFGVCGGIEDVAIVRHLKTGLSKRYGFVLFATMESKEKALALEDVEIDGKTIRIDAIDKKRKQKSNSPVKEIHLKAEELASEGKMEQMVENQLKS